jgi:hypothetical protein
MLDDIFILNRTLTASEAYQLYASNLQKFNSTQWYLYANQSKNATTGLDAGTYSYFVSAKDLMGNENVTANRVVTVNSAADLINPQINYITVPENASTITNTSLVYNLSIVEQNLNEVKWNWTELIALCIIKFSIDV